jgi:hypothetical protein
VKSIPMLHFHQIAGGIVADLKRVLPRVAGFDRIELHDRRDWQALLEATAERCRLLQEKKRT